MLRDIGKYLIIAIILVSVYKFFGGDIGAFLNSAWEIVVKVVNTGADWFVSTGFWDWVTSL